MIFALQYKDTSFVITVLNNEIFIFQTLSFAVGVRMISHAKRMCISDAPLNTEEGGVCDVDTIRQNKWCEEHFPNRGSFFHDFKNLTVIFLVFARIKSASEKSLVRQKRNWIGGNILVH